MAQDFTPKFESAEIGGPLWREAVANPARFRIFRDDEKIDLRDLKDDGRRLILQATHVQARQLTGKHPAKLDAFPKFRGRFDPAALATEEDRVERKLGALRSERAALEAQAFDLGYRAGQQITPADLLMKGSIDPDWADTPEGRVALAPQLTAGVFAQQIADAKAKGDISAAWTALDAKIKEKDARQIARRKVDPKATLADDIQDPRNDLSPNLPASELTRDRQAIAQARRFVLDHDAALLAVNLATTDPKGCLDLLANAEPGQEYTWIEYPQRAIALKTLAMASLENDTPEVELEAEILKLARIPAPCREGILVRNQGGSLYIHRFLHADAPTFGIFPIGWRVALDGKITAGDVGDHEDTGSGTVVWAARGARPPHTQAAIIWGYDRNADESRMKPLTGRACGTTHPRFMGALEASDANRANRAQAGHLRVALAMLAMLNSVATIEETTRPPGGRLIRGAVRPYLSRAAVTITVPKRIRKVVEWARSEVRAAGARKKLHEVRPHFRHLKAQPRTPGWLEVQIGGETYYRKRIDGHLRGDPDLGVVEHSHTVVRGPKPAPRED
jgi:hypothetical protein